MSNSKCSLTLLVFFGATFAHAQIARAEETDGPSPGTVPVHVTVGESFSLRGQGSLSSVKASCNTPCVVHLLPGEYKYYSTNNRAGPIVAFSGPSRLDLYGPSQPLQTSGLIIGGIGVIGVIGPLVAIYSTCAGRDVASSRRCLNFGEGTGLGLTIVAGIGLSMTVLGSILYFMSGGGLKVTDVDPKSARLKVGTRHLDAFARGALFTF